MYDLHGLESVAGSRMVERCTNAECLKIRITTGDGLAGNWHQPKSGEIQSDERVIQRRACGNHCQQKAQQQARESCRVASVTRTSDGQNGSNVAAKPKSGRRKPGKK